MLDYEAEEGSALKDIGKEQLSRHWNFPLKVHCEQKDILTNYKKQKPKPNVSMSEDKNSCHVLFLKGKENEQTCGEFRIEERQYKNTLHKYSSKKYKGTLKVILKWTGPGLTR